MICTQRSGLQISWSTVLKESRAAAHHEWCARIRIVRHSYCICSPSCWHLACGLSTREPPAIHVIHCIGWSYAVRDRAAQQHRSLHPALHINYVTKLALLHSGTKHSTVRPACTSGISPLLALLSCCAATLFTVSLCTAPTQLAHPVTSRVLDEPALASATFTCNIQRSFQALTLSSHM